MSAPTAISVCPGPNATTWILAGELYPTAMRTSAHGFSAGTAKCGALFASVWFNYIGNRMKFWTSAAFSAVRAVCYKTLIKL
jgi:hypothetical protein